MSCVSHKFIFSLKEQISDTRPKVYVGTGIFLEEFILKPQADAVLQKMQASPSDSKEREKFVKERRDLADIVSEVRIVTLPV